MIIPDVVNIHLEDAAFLWLLRDAAVDKPHYDLSDLVELDDRLDAHLDGLRLAGEEGWNICREILLMEDGGEIFVGAVLALLSGSPERFQALLEMADVGYDLYRGVSSAVGWLGAGRGEEAVRSCMPAGGALFHYFSLAGSALSRQDPGALLAEGLDSDDLSFRARALKAVGELGRHDLAPHLKQAPPGEDEKCHFYASWSRVLLGGQDGIDQLVKITENRGLYAERACGLALRAMGLERGHAWLRELSQQAGSPRLAVSGAGVLGDPVSIPWLFEVMETPELARNAGESFSMITGLDLAEGRLELGWPEGFTAGPTEDPEDDEVAVDRDEDLPWPNQELVANWWQENRGDFRDGSRYLAGKPIAAENLHQVLQRGYQRQRAAAALELCLLQPGKPLFEVRAPGFRQLKMLGA